MLVHDLFSFSLNDLSDRRCTFIYDQLYRKWYIGTFFSAFWCKDTTLKTNNPWLAPRINGKIKLIDSDAVDGAANYSMLAIYNYNPVSHLQISKFECYMTPDNSLTMK